MLNTIRLSFLSKIQIFQIKNSQSYIFRNYKCPAPKYFHQEIFFTWAYCIRKNEFRTIYKRRLTKTALKNVVYVKFRRTNTSTKCEWSDNLKGFKASNQL